MPVTLEARSLTNYYTDNINSSYSSSFIGQQLKPESSSVLKTLSQPGLNHQVESVLLDEIETCREGFRIIGETLMDTSLIMRVS